MINMTFSFVLFILTSFVSGTFSQNVINKNTLKRQCDFQDIMKTKFTVSEYENNPSNFKYIYNIDKEVDEDTGVSLYIDRETCLFMSDKYKQHAFKNQNEYYKINKFVVLDIKYMGYIDNCLLLQYENMNIKECSCIIINAATTQASTTRASTTQASTTRASTTQASTTQASTTRASTTRASTTTNSINNYINKSGVSEASKIQEIKINMSSGTLIGIIVGSILGVFFILLPISSIILKKRKKNKKNQVIENQVIENPLYDTNFNKSGANSRLETDLNNVYYEEPITYNPEYTTYNKQHDDVGYEVNDPSYIEYE